MQKQFGIGKSIAYRFVLYIFFCSALVTLISTAVQVFFEYRRDVGQIAITVDQIRRAHVTTLVPHLWIYDRSMLEAQIQGIKNLPDVSYVSIQKSSEQLLETGMPAQGAYQSYDFPLTYKHRGQDQELGTLKVEVSLQGMHHRLWSSVRVIFFTETLKIFFVSIFIFFIFHYFVGRHLYTMAAFARSFSLTNLDDPLVIQRRERKGQEYDELSLVESAINNMRENLIQEIGVAKSSQEALARSEARFRSLVSNIPGIVYRCALWPTRKFEYISDLIEQIIGYSSQELLTGQTSLDLLIHPEDLLRVNNEFNASVAVGKPYEIEYRIFHKDGGVRWLFEKGIAVYDEDHKPLWLDGVILDITEKKRVVLELQKSEERVRLFFERQLVGMAITSPEKGWMQVNGRLCEMLGYTQDELAKLNWADLTYPEDLAPDLIQFERLIAGEIDDYTIEKRFVRKDGLVIHTNLAVACVRQADGAVDYILALLEDLTARKQAEKEREDVQAQLTQAQKMESVGRLAGGVAHDFNNMLGVILGYSELILEQVDENQPIHSALQGIQQAAQRSADLTRQLLAFARKQTIAPKVIDLNKTVESMTKMLLRLIGEDLDLAWLPGKNLWLVKMDPTQIDQMLANLCVNARDAIADTGKVTIETGNVFFDATYCAGHTGFIPGEFVLLAVSDNGCGMAPEIISHLFEPFFTTKKMDQGTGLGLATVYGIVKQNNGFINVYSEPGQGTTFKVYLPRYVPLADEKPEAEVATPALSGHETILLVEDEPMILDMTMAMLERLGYTVLAGATPGEAIRLAREHAGKIDLLMTDVVMPEMNGRDLAKNLLTLYPDLKRLFMSGYTANVIAHHGVLDEGVHFIQKPFTLKGLAAKVRGALSTEA
ncbi:PAS domain S-box protein [Desulfobulbus sp.]|uniref:PAS domain S-box protein n=1 Tax=Desulfobulbus sp. TaxID=895 RepID=UPI0027B96789|nr:PAS domain S-box protein [Desulfobulbus sp.]